MSKEVMKMALEALEHPGNIYHIDCPRNTVITALREALAEQPAQQGCMRCNTPKKCALYGCSPLTWPAEQPAQQEPVAWRDPTNANPGQGCTYIKARAERSPHIYKQALYTSPPAQRKPLTLREIGAVCGNFSDETIKVVRQTEAAHGIKGDA